MHVHIFPEAIAHKAVHNLGEYYHVTMNGKGTWEDLQESLKEAKVIKKCLIHSTATAAHQVRAVNDYVSQFKSDDIYCFGSMHPDYDDIEVEIDRMIALGIKGIKLHTDFQLFNADDEKAFRIYDYAQGKLPVLFHAGDENVDYSSPKRLRHVHDMFPGLKIICAHLGGYSQWDAAEKYLVGTDVYFDTSSCLQSIDPDQARRIIKNHGVDKCFFGTDYPMHNQSKCVQDFLGLGFSDEENEKILWNNALKFLGEAE